MRRASLAMLLGLASLAFAQNPEPRVIVRSGTIVDGKGLARFREPQSGGGGQVAFRASSETITLPEGDGTRDVIGTGAPLPAPLRGTLNTFVQAWSTDDGFVVFDAELNSPDADRGVFALDGGALTAIVTRRVSRGEALTSFEMDPTGVVVYGTDDGVYRWTRATGASERIAVLSAGPLDGPRIALDGAIVWMTADGVVYWTGTSGGRDVARLGAPSALGGTPFTSFRRADVDVTTGDVVAFVATTGSAEAAFVWSPLTGQMQAVAQVGDPIDGEPITRFSTQIRVDLDDSVYFRARVGRRNRWVRWLGGDAFEVVRRPPRRDFGSAAVSYQDGLYLADGRRIRTVARIGDELPAIGRVATLDTVRVRGASVFVSLYAEDGRMWIARYRRGRLRPIVAPGDVIPGVGQVFPFGDFDASGDALVFLSEHGVVVRRGSRTQVLQRPETLSPLASLDVWRLRLDGSTVVMAAATYDPPAAGIYVARGARLVPFVEVGQPIPGKPRTVVSSIDDLQVDGHRRLFTSRLVGRDDVELFLANGSRVVRMTMDLAGDPPRRLYPDTIALDGGLVLFRDGDVVYRATSTGPRPVVETGQSTSKGTLDFVTTDDLYGGITYAPAGHEVVFATRFVGGRSRSALLARRVLRDD